MDRGSTETLYAVAIRAFILTAGDAHVILDDTHGQYWAIDAVTHAVFAALHDAPHSAADVTLAFRGRYSDDECAAALAELLEASLIRRIDQNAPPSARTVVLLVLFNWIARIDLRLRGWATVRATRRTAPPRRQPQCPISSVVGGVLAAARLSYLVPGVSAECVPRSLAMLRLLRHFGYDAELQVGANVDSFEPHMWVSVEGQRVDNGLNEPSLDTFRPFHLLLPEKADGTAAGLSREIGHER